MMNQILFAGVIGLFLTLIGTPLLIKLLARKGYGQYIRDDGPREHASCAQHHQHGERDQDPGASREAPPRSPRALGQLDFLGGVEQRTADLGDAAAAGLKTAGEVTADGRPQRQRPG